MHYRVLRPSVALSRYVQCYWVLEGHCTPTTQIVLPDGTVELVFQYGDSQRQPRNLLYGQLRQRALVQSAGRVGALGVRFRPGSAYRFFRFPQSDFTDQMLPLDDVWGNMVREIEEQVLEARDNSQRMLAVERAVARQIRNAQDLPVLDEALYLIQSSGGALGLERLSTMVNSSPRQLERHFRERLGLGPKMFARIVRFQLALRAIRRQGMAGAFIAADCGYYDQAHLIREFREFTGQTPTEYRRHAAEISRVYGGPAVPAFVGFLQDGSGRTDYAGFTTFRRLLWRPAGLDSTQESAP